MENIAVDRIREFDVGLLILRYDIFYSKDDVLILIIGETLESPISSKENLKMLMFSTKRNEVIDEVFEGEKSLLVAFDYCYQDEMVGFCPNYHLSENEIRLFEFLPIDAKLKFDHCFSIANELVYDIKILKRRNMILLGNNTTINILEFKSKCKFLEISVLNWSSCALKKRSFAFLGGSENCCIFDLKRKKTKYFKGEFSSLTFLKGRNYLAVGAQNSIKLFEFSEQKLKIVQLFEIRGSFFLPSIEFINSAKIVFAEFSSLVLIDLVSKRAKKLMIMNDNNFEDTILEYYSREIIVRDSESKLYFLNIGDYLNN